MIFLFTLEETNADECITCFLKKALLVTTHTHKLNNAGENGSLDLTTTSNREK